MAHGARAFWVVAPGRGEIREEALAPAAADHARVRTRYSGISRGTETLVFSGHVPASEYARMRAPLQAGDFPAPVKYGYVNVGTVEEGPPHLLGRDVFCLAPHQTVYLAPAEMLYPLPERLPSARAVLAANMETALNAIWDARPHVGDRIAVVGGGTVGCLVAWLASRIGGCSVQLVDINDARSAVAAALSVSFVRPDAAERNADLVIHASGSEAGLTTALSLAGFEATVIELSWYGDKRASVPLGEAFHSQRLTIRSSQVGAVATSQRARWSYRRRMQLALDLLADPALDVLITGESAFEELPEVMAQLASKPGDTLCHRIRYDQQHV